MTSDSSLVAGHAIGIYLPRSATFIHTMVRFQQRFQPVVLAGRTENLEEFPIDGRITDLGGAAPRLVRAARRLAARVQGAPTAYGHRLTSAAARHGCAILHAHWGSMGWTALPARRSLGVPLVTTFYGYDLALSQQDRAWDARYAELFQQGDVFVCEGPAMGRRLQGLGCPAEKIAIVKIGLDLDHFPFVPRERTDGLVAIQCARFEEKKGIDVSIRAFAAARSRGGPSELWLVGDGPLRPDLERLAAKLGVSGSVRFLGLLSHHRYREALARAQLGIQPSRTAADGDTEGGAPTVLLEMQASGMPVVATHHADIPAVVADPGDLAAENDADGVSDALVRLATASEDEWRARLQRGRRLIEAEHDARALSRRIEDVYRQLIEVRR